MKKAFNGNPKGNPNNPTEGGIPDEGHLMGFKNMQAMNAKVAAEKNGLPNGTKVVNNEEEQESEDEDQDDQDQHADKKSKKKD